MQTETKNEQMFGTCYFQTYVQIIFFLKSRILFLTILFRYSTQKWLTLVRLWLVSVSSNKCLDPFFVIILNLLVTLHTHSALYNPYSDKESLNKRKRF